MTQIISDLDFCGCSCQGPHCFCRKAYLATKLQKSIATYFDGYVFAICQTTMLKNKIQKTFDKENLMLFHIIVVAFLQVQSNERLLFLHKEYQNIATIRLANSNSNNISTWTNQKSISMCFFCFIVVSKPACVDLD